MDNDLKVIISGGGTGGHIFPALSIAGAIREIRPGARILFVGALGKMEMEKVPAAGYEIKGIPAKGLKRPLYSPGNIRVMLDYLKCKKEARKIIKDFAPDIVVGVGGFASAATVGTAAEMGIPVLIQEQNSYAGVVNRKNAKRADRICVAYEGMERFFPKEKIILTGNPIRKDIVKSTPDLKARGYEYYRLDPSLKTVFVVGGSLGCGTLNRCMKNEIDSGDLFTPGPDGRPSCQVIWQCGKYYKEEIDRFMQQRHAPHIIYTDFIQRMDLAYAAADVVVSRAGAGTISELCAAGKCTVFVPSPNVAEDHQTHNAMALVKKEAALIIKDAQADGELMPLVKELLKDDTRREVLEANISALARTDAAGEIAAECIRLAEEKTRNKTRRK